MMFQLRQLVCLFTFLALTVFVAAEEKLQIGMCIFLPSEFEIFYIERVNSKEANHLSIHMSNRYY